MRLVLILIAALSALSGVEAQVSTGGEYGLVNTLKIKPYDASGDGIEDSALAVSRGINHQVKAFGLESWEYKLNNIEDACVVEGIAVLLGNSVVGVNKGEGLWSIDERGYSCVSLDTDGNGLYDTVVVGGSSKIFAVDANGNILWKKDAGTMNRHISGIRKYAFASSGPTIYIIKATTGSIAFSKTFDNTIVDLAPLEFDDGYGVVVAFENG